MSQSQGILWADGMSDRQTLFHRTLPAEARDPTTSLQQVTGGNTPNLVLKRTLRYFPKIPPIKKNCNFKTKIRQKREKQKTSNQKFNQ